jgi:hypothetical protein
MEAPDGSHFSWSNLVEVVKREMAQGKVSVSRLTQAHLNLTSRTKMTVSLASRVFTRRVVRAFEVFYTKDGEEVATRGRSWYINLMAEMKEIFRSAEPITSKEDKRLSRMNELANEVYEWIENRGMTGGVWNELLQTDFFDNI